MRGRQLHRLFPGIAVLRNYRRDWLRGDLLAGVAVTAYLIPQVMAYAEIAGLPAAAGLWAICGSLATYAIFGSSRQLSIGPESTTALMTAAAIAPLAGGDPARYATLAAGLALMVGVLCVLGWAARAGALADLLSKPVLIGYLAGIAVIMIVGQLGKVTGVPVEGDSPGAELLSFVTNLGTTNLPTLVLSLGLLVFLLVGSRLWPRWPVLLVGMLAATAVVAVFSLQDVGIQVVGESATGLPSLAVPALSAADLPALMLAAVGVVIVGYSDNVLTARAFASRRREQIDSNTELLALGTANLASGLLRGFPVSSSGSRTAVANAQGSQTQLYSLTALALVLLVLAVGGAVLAGFPTAALGTVVIFAAISLIDLPAFRRLKEVRRSELVLALATTAAVLVLGVLYGVLAAVALSIVDLLRRISRPHDGILGYVPEVAGMHDVDDYPDARPVPGLVVYRYDAPLFFANAEDFRRRALAAVRDAPTDPHWLLLNVEAIIEVDSTAIDALEALRAELTDRGIVFAMARVKQDLRADLRPSGFLDAVGEDRIFMTLPTAVAAYEKWHEQRFGRPPHDDPA
jgi:high affinity sulfate transporter 1